MQKSKVPVKGPNIHPSLKRPPKAFGDDTPRIKPPEPHVEVHDPNSGETFPKV